MKTLSIIFLVLALAGAIARIWTGDTRWTGTGIVLLVAFATTGLIALGQIGMAQENTEEDTDE